MQNKFFIILIWFSVFEVFPSSLILPKNRTPDYLIEIYGINEANRIYDIFLDYSNNSSLKI